MTNTTNTTTAIDDLDNRISYRLQRLVEGKQIDSSDFAADVRKLIDVARSAAPAPAARSERDGWEAAAKAIAERAQGHKGSDYELYEECLQCVAMLNDMKPAAPAVEQSAESAAELPPVPRTYQQTEKERAAIEAYGQACIAASRRTAGDALTPTEREQFDQMDPPDAPCHYSSAEAGAWGSGWLAGYEASVIAHKRHRATESAAAPADRATAGTTAVEAPGHKDCYCGGWTDDTGDYHQSGCPEIVAGTTAAPIYQIYNLDSQAWLDVVHEDYEAEPDDNRRIVYLAAERATAGNAAPTEADENAPWLTLAHMICADAGIQPGHITDRLKTLRDLLDAALRGNAATAAPGDLTNEQIVDITRPFWNERTRWFDVIGLYKFLRQQVASNAGTAPGMVEVGTLSVFPDKEASFGFAYDISTTYAGHKVLQSLDGATLYVAAPSNNSPVGGKDKA